MTFTWTKKAENNSYHDREFSHDRWSDMSEPQEEKTKTIRLGL